MIREAAGPICIALLCAGPVLLFLSLKEEVGDAAVKGAGIPRYEVPEGLGGSYAFPGDELEYSVAEHSVPFEIRFSDAKDWASQSQKQNWYADPKPVGDFKAFTRRGNCKYYIERRSTGGSSFPCNVASTPAALRFQIIDDRSLIGARVAFSVKLEDQPERTVAFRISDPKAFSGRFKTIYWSSSIGAVLTGVLCFCAGVWLDNRFKIF